MNYYRHQINHKVYAFENEQLELICDDLNYVKMTDSEVKLHLNPPVPREQIIHEAEYKKQEYLNNASDVLAPLQDAIDLNIATDKELMQLNAWKQYRVDLNRIDTASAPDIAWPEKPQ